MASSVYIETSVISYYTARPSRDVVSAARQTLTQEWWEEARHKFDLYVSVLVVEEAKGGGAEAAQRRLAAISGLPILEINDAAEKLARRLLDEGAIPSSRAEDALHISPGDRARDGFSFDMEFPSYQQCGDESENQDHYRGGRV